MNRRIIGACAVACVALTMTGYALLVAAILGAFGRSPGWTSIAIGAVLAMIIIFAIVSFPDVFPTTSRAERIANYLLTPAWLLMLPVDYLDERWQQLRWPRSLEAAVDRLLDGLDQESREQLLQEPPNTDWSGFGMGIRNDFGLWQGNEELIASCGVQDDLIPADAACGVIIDRLIQKLRETRNSTSDEAAATRE